MNRRGGFDVAVVGAGMVGSAVALALAQKGLRVCLIEEREPARWSVSDELDLRVVALAPSSVNLLRSLGVWDAIAAARVSPYRHMHVWDAQNGATLDFDAATLGESELGYIVENRLLQHVLWQALLGHPGIEVRSPARVVETRADEQGRALLLDDDRRVTAQLVVAADGGNSALRAMLGIATRGEDYAQRALVAHVRTELPHAQTAWQRFLPGGPLALLPLADGRSSIVWTLPEVEAERMLALDDSVFCKELGCAFDFRLGPILATSPRAAFPLRLQLAERYIDARFALIGDAAHSVHPLAGQGVNLGFRDVEELVECLVDASERGRDIAAESTLRRYERRRRSDNAIAGHAFGALNRIFRWSAEPAVLARGLGMRMVGTIGPVRNALARHAAGR
ncbi:MAG: UbiH/UbiF/VisC/COQ6 family ubiquinone biosynthesis hydroxylase [Tahibacter sp.]